MKTEYVLIIEEPDDLEDPRETKEGMVRMQVKDDILEQLEDLAVQYNGESGLRIEVEQR